VDPVPDPLLLRENLAAQRRESKPGPMGLQSGSLTTRPQRRSYNNNNNNNNNNKIILLNFYS
jgi:hypothetical protein